MKLARLFALSTLLLVAHLSRAADVSPGWVQRSNAYTQILLDIGARYYPESSAEMGVEGYDEAVQSIPLNLNQRIVRDYEHAIADLRAKLPNETDVNVRQDIEILIKAADQSVRGTRLNEKYDLPYFDLHALVFSGIRALLDDRVPAERRQAALVRLRKYAGLEHGISPLTKQAEAFTRAALKDRDLRGPFKDNLAKDFGNAQNYVDGIAELFQKYGIKDWQEPFEKLKQQLAGYQQFLHTEVEPRATVDFRLPAEEYRFALEQRGIDWPVEELSGRAKAAFSEIRNQMQILAPLIARERGFPSNDYRDVIRELKKSQFEGEQILPHYQNRIHEIEAIIAREKIVSLPQREMRIRLASAAESAQVPAPSMSPPRMIGNTGEMGEFVLPLKIPAEAGKEAIGFDDFTFEAASWTLTAHEGRPGHELQFAAMIEGGVSQARALFAMNSVNVEGWALYAEAEMQQYEPLEGQLIALQHRLLRSARALLDPGLQSGEISREQAFRILENDVVLSHAMALQEVERYTFWAPGQAPSYFCGYQHLMELRTDVERELAGKFERQAFHDFLLRQGALPPDLLRKAVMEGFVAPRKATTG